MKLLSLVAASTLIAIAPAGAAGAAPSHGVEFWRGIKAADFALPDGAAPGPLLLEMCDLLGSPDPEVRDGLAYDVAAAWIYAKRTASDDDLRPVIALLEKNLAAGIGENGTETVLRRSFSALVLSLVAARDNAQPFLTRDEFDGLVSAALVYLAREKDERGFVPPAGWHHSVAHTADLLKFIGRNPKLQPADQKRILAGISLKVSGSAAVWSYGEDDRLAAAVMSLLRRDDADLAAFEGWADRFPSLWQTAWADAPGLDPAHYAAAKNGRDLLAMLYVQLGMATPFPGADRARSTVQAALKRM